MRAWMGERVCVWLFMHPHAIAFVVERLCMHVCLLACVRVHMCVYVCVGTRARVYVCAWSCVHACARICVCKCAYVRGCLYVRECIRGPRDRKQYTLEEDGFGQWARARFSLGASVLSCIWATLALYCILHNRVYTRMLCTRERDRIHDVGP